MHAILHESDHHRVAPGMLIGNFDRRLYTSKQFVSKVVDVTVAIAEEFLERAGIIHNPSKARVERLAVTMNRHDWRLTHQGIAFNWEGKLVDGVARLQAIIKSGQTQQMQVTFGLDPRDYPAIDTGAGRKGRHLLHIAGMPKKETTTAEAAIRLYLRYTEAVQQQKLPPSAKVTAQNIHAFHLEHENFATIVEELLNMKQTWSAAMSPAVATVLVFMAMRARFPKDVALGFIKRIGAFAHQGEHHPILVLYKTLKKDKEMKRYKPEEALVKSIRAFNKWATRQEVSVLRGLVQYHAHPGQEPERHEERQFFPSVVGYSARHHRDVNNLD